MKSLAPVQQLRRIASFLVIILSLQASPVPVYAALYQPPAKEERDVAAVVADLKEDLRVLETQGKEAYLDRLFERLDRDEARAIELLIAKIKAIGARRLCQAILMVGSPVLAAMLAVVPESWQEKLVIAAVSKFIRKSVAQLKRVVTDLPAETIARGLKAIVTLVGDPSNAAHAFRDSSWWESFFSNSTAVRNFIITIVALGSIGVAVGLAIAGATAAPVVAVVGALVSLIALIVPSSQGGLAED